jgi:ACR3 family arsenite efflux pump ArsB
VTGSEPGLILGIFLVAGTAAGALAVHPRAAYLIIPVPALAYLVAAVVAGAIHDHAADSSHTAAAISAAQWIASGFVAMSAATLLAIAVAAVRWAGHRRRGWPQRRPLAR